MPRVRPGHDPGTSVRRVHHVGGDVCDLDTVLAAVARLGYVPMHDVVQDEDVYRRCPVRGPGGTTAELAEPLGGS